jgi:hypothetical protein
MYRKKIRLSPEVTLEGSTYSFEEWNGSKGPTLDADDDLSGDAAPVSVPIQTEL